MLLKLLFVSIILYITCIISSNIPVFDIDNINNYEIEKCLISPNCYKLNNNFDYEQIIYCNTNETAIMGSDHALKCIINKRL